MMNKTMISYMKNYTEGQELTKEFKKGIYGIIKEEEIEDITIEIFGDTFMVNLVIYSPIDSYDIAVLNDYMGGHCNINSYNTDELLLRYEFSPMSERDKIQTVVDAIKLLEEEYAKAPSTILIDDMKDKYNISQEETEKIVKNLVIKGIIYEPQKNMFKIVT